MSTEDETRYDSGDFSFVAFAFLSCLVIPYTLYLIRAGTKRTRKHLATLASYQGCACDGCKEKKQKTLAKHAEWDPMDAVMWAVAGVGWALWAAALIAVLSQSAKKVEVFDPFKVLDIAESATEKEIKRAHKRLSVKWHPDKNPGNEDQAAIQFIEVTRAYKTLTDPVAKKNWIEYGNPDGPQGFSMGMALPAFLVDSGNSTLVLLGYICVVLGLLPYAAVRLWNSWRFLAPNAVSYNSMYLYNAFFTSRARSVSEIHELVEVLAASDEFVDLPIRASDPTALESLQVGMTKSLAKEHRPHREGTREPEFRKRPSALKGTILLYAHINRVPVEGPAKDDLGRLLEGAPGLVDGMLSIMQSKRQAGVLWQQMIPVMQLGATILQACWPDQEFLQLPHVTPMLAAKLVGKVAKNKKGKTLRDVLAMEPDERRRLFTGDAKDGGLTRAQFEDVERVMARIPLHVAVDVKVKVEDEIAFISPGAVVQLTVQCTRVPTQAKAEELTKVDVADVDNVAALVAAGVKLKGQAAQKAKEAARKALEEAKAKGLDKEKKSADGDESDEEDDWEKDESRDDLLLEVPPVFAHAPRVPQDVRERHWVFLTTARGLVSSSIKKITINGPEEEKETVKLMFQAPDAPGTYEFGLFVVSDTYHGAHMRVPVSIVVYEAPEPTAPSIDDEIDSDDEVSLSEEETDDEDDDVDDK